MGTSAAVPKLRSFLERLQQLSLQSAYTLLKRCGIPKWIYLLRCHEPDVTAAANKLADEAVERCVTELLGGFGNLEGNPFHNHHMTANLLGAQPYSTQAETLYSRAKTFSYGRSYLEKHLSRGPEVEKESTPTNQVHALQLMDKRTGYWMEAWRNRGEYYLRDSEWQTAARMRYMIAPVSSPVVQCVCGETLANAQFVVHALDCHKVKGATAATRHKMVKEVFTRILKKYGFCPDLHEPRFSDGKGPDVCFAMGTKNKSRENV